MFNPVEDCKKKLKNLKDRMREVCGKLPKTKSGQPAFESGEMIVRWPYYKPLLFMRDQFVGRDMVGNVECTNPSQCMDNTADESLDGTESIVSQLTEPSTTSEVDQSKKNKIAPKPKRQKLDEEFLAIEREKIDSLKKALVIDGTTKTQDEWDTFSQCICSDLCKLKDPVIILRAKASINKIVNDSVLEQISLDRETSSAQSQRHYQYHQYQDTYSTRQTASFERSSTGLGLNTSLQSDEGGYYQAQYQQN